jgi:ABC-type branched-subunit amino acid transport system ATPase component
VTAPRLEVLGVEKRFGGVVAVRDVTFRVPTRTVHALIGPNGAGKTTLFNVVSGLLAADRGEVRLDGRALNGLGPAARAALGVARTFQNLQIFGDMTVLENVVVGRHRRAGVGLLGAALRTPATLRAERAIHAAAWATLEFVGLAHRGHDPAGSLPLGQQRLLEIARALALEPTLLLLDEPAAGLTSAELGRLGELIGAIRAQGTTVLLVEHHMDLVMGISDTVLVLHHGEVLAEGPPEMVRSHRGVVEAYLGVDDDAA